MSVKDRLVKNIVAPVASSHSSAYMDAVVIKADESRNTCDVKYSNNEGIMVEQVAVPVQLHNVNIIDWFPKVREHVTVTAKGGDIFITGPSYGFNYNLAKNKNKLVQDIFSDISSSTMGGFIF